MSVNGSGKKQCVTCSKSGGIMTCDGCQQSFCGKHATGHRQELANQLDGIVQEHDLLQQELGKSLVDNCLLKQINKWEFESIAKVQVTAEAARADLLQFLDNSNKRVLKACHDIAVNLRSSREADDFSEDDLNQWIEQLKELKLEITLAPSIKLTEDEHFAIPLITIMNSSFTDKKPATSKQPSYESSTKDRNIADLQQYFHPTSDQNKPVVPQKNNHHQNPNPYGLPLNVEQNRQIKDLKIPCPYEPQCPFKNAHHREVFSHPKPLH